MSSPEPLESKVLNLVRYYYYDIWNLYGDPRVKAYPFMSGGPWSTLGLIVIYLCVVKRLGPSFMKDRKAFDLKRIIITYNITLVVINGWFFSIGFWVTNFGLDSWKCAPVDKLSQNSEDLYKIKLGWLFYITKLVDFCDTLFFILRKKERQLSGLHVFHHSVMPFFCWIGLKFAPGGNSAFFPLINCTFELKFDHKKYFLHNLSIFAIYLACYCRLSIILKN